MMHLTFTTSNSTPMAGSGVRMSLNIITPSGLKARQGCRESSIAMSAVSERCRNPYLSEYSRNSDIYLPAWRISQTGGRSPCSPRATRSKRGSSLEEEETTGTVLNVFFTACVLGTRVTRPWTRLLKVGIADDPPTPHRAVICVRLVNMPSVTKHKCTSAKPIDPEDNEHTRDR